MCCSLAVEELLEYGDDDSLGLGLGEEKNYAGVKLSGNIHTPAIINTLRS